MRKQTHKKNEAFSTLLQQPLFFHSEILIICATLLNHLYTLSFCEHCVFFYYLLHFVLYDRHIVYLCCLNLLPKFFQIYSFCRPYIITIKLCLVLQTKCVPEIIQCRADRTNTSKLNSLILIIIIITYWKNELPS